MHTTEMRMLGWARRKTRLDIWKEACMYPMAEFLREKRLRWFGHVQRRDKDDATRKILQMTVDGKRNRGRPKLRWRDLRERETSLFATRWVGFKHLQYIQYKYNKIPTTW